MLFYVILLPPLVALLVAGLQQLVYTGLVKAGRIKADDVPFFGIFVFRGLLVAMALVLVMTMVSKAKNPEIENDPLWSEQQRESLIEEKYGTAGERKDVAPPQANDAELESLIAPQQGDQTEQIEGEQQTQPPSTAAENPQAP